jgi:hypothetical protein
MTITKLALVLVCLMPVTLGPKEAKVTQHHDVLNRDFQLRLIFTTTVKSVGYRQESIQFP